jgi:hypothetical protein
MNQEATGVEIGEKRNGTFVIPVPDLDAAIAWAEKCPGAQCGAVEIRPSACAFAERAWHSAG